MTTSPITEQRSGIANENLQEILDAEDNAGWTLQGGAAQYLTPDWFALECAEKLRRAITPNCYAPQTVLDPQCGDGALVRSCSCHNTFGIDIDNRINDSYSSRVYHHIIGNCVKVMEAFDDVFPDTRWDWINCNPPFGKRWKTAEGKTIDSTLFTWHWAITHSNAGFFIANANTIEKFGISKHEYVFDYNVRTDIWDNVEIPIGIVFWRRPSVGWNTTAMWDLKHRWEQINLIIQAEKNNRPDWNIYLDANGFLRTYLSLRSEVKLKLSKEAIAKLAKINKAHPLTLTTEKESRALLKSFVDAGVYTIEPRAKAAIESALSEVAKLATPLLPVTDFECVAYADEEDVLECVQTCHLLPRAPFINFGPDPKGRTSFTAGRKYSIDTGTYKFKREFTRRKPHYNDETKENYILEHDCELTGQDRYISVTTDTGRVLRFMDTPQGGHDFDELLLWSIFKKPVVPTVADVSPELVQHFAGVLDGCEMVAGYKYYPGQKTFVPRVAVKDRALVGSAVGTGKTLIALSLLACKGPNRALIIAPQGCIRSGESDEDEDGTEYQASQWITEINKFAPYLQIWELFSLDDYHRICSLNGGELPPGVYVTYYQAMFRNRAQETAPPNWNDDRLQKELNTLAQTDVTLPKDFTDKRHWCNSIGREVEGMRCIISPCLSTLIGEQFDMVLLDECHTVTNLDAAVTQMLIRMQPKYRYAFSATPIPNIVSNLFSLMGWICVDDWYKGNRRNAAWPFARSDLKFFENTFMCMERDFTQEDINKANDPDWKGKCIKASPVISAPARLLKLLKPSLAYASKLDMNPDYKEARLVDVRVKLGLEQAKLYAYYLDRANIPASHPLVRARKQTAWLRSICADPAGFRHGIPNVTPKVHSNMNPKVIATLELVREILAQGEQVVIVSARVGLTDTIQEKLMDAGVPVCRIDSTVSADQHSRQSNMFKERKAPVMLMGIRCAQAYSFPQCKYIIAVGIEFSPGPLNQALGRVDRVNSRPGVTCYCILCTGTVEEHQWDVVCVKDDAATICLKGKRTPRDFKPVDPSEVLAAAIEGFDLTGAVPEHEIEAQWPALRNAIKLAFANFYISK